MVMVSVVNYPPAVKWAYDYRLLLFHNSPTKQVILAGRQ